MTPTPTNQPSEFDKFQSLARRILTTPKPELVKDAPKKICQDAAQKAEVIAMREIEVGCKIPEGGGMTAFGEAEVNELIRQGWRVVAVKGKGALMREMPPIKGEKQWGFIGYAMIVHLEPPIPETQP